MNVGSGQGEENLHLVWLFMVVFVFFSRAFVGDVHFLKVFWQYGCGSKIPSI